jgi:hypothetical protein
VQHLLDIMASLTEEDRDTFLTALTRLTHMFQKGLLPEVIAQYASSAIAVGVTFRMLAAKVSNKHAISLLKPYL